MRSETALRRLNTSLTAKSQTRRRVLQEISHRINEPSLLSTVQFPVPKRAKAAVWNTLTQRIGALHTVSLLDQVRQAVKPTAARRRQIGSQVSGRVSGLAQPLYMYSRFKWIAATMVAAIVITSSPAFFLANTIVAEATVLLVPTEGEIEVTHGDTISILTEEMTLEPGMRLSTGDGQASIIYRDDAVLRLDHNTVLIVRDTDELTAVAPEVVPSFTLVEGRIWVQGLIPANLRGLTIAVPYGNTTVNEGSVSVATTDRTTTVSVWDRHTDVFHNGDDLFLVAGEFVELQAENSAPVQKISDADIASEWAQQNQERDEVHRQYVAQLQKDRRAAKAGILPTSSLYPVKRAAEEVDVFLTFDDDARVQKKLKQADNRLNEAVALLAEGQQPVEVEATLDTYRAALLDAIADSGSSSTVSQFMIRQSLSETIADMAALSPTDDSYVLKKTVLQTTAELPSETLLNPQELQTMLFVDSLQTLNKAVESGDADTLQETWSDLQEYVGVLESEDSGLAPELRKEAQALLERFAVAVETNSNEVAAVDNEVLDEIMVFVPQKPVAPVRPLLSNEEVQQTVQAMFERIYVFKMPQSRENQLRVELNNISGDPEEGRYLRALYRLIPSQSRLSYLIRQEIIRLRWKLAEEN